MAKNSSTALLVIDVQESFRSRADDWAHRSNPDVIDNVGRLVDAARSAGQPVIWILHAEPESGGVFDPERGLIRVVDDLDPRDDEARFVKTSINAFTTTGLQQTLVQQGIGRLVICGIRTDQCCETTARVASDLGFDVVFVTDATATSDIPAAGALSAVTGAELMQRTESVLAARGFADIATTAQLLEGEGGAL